MFRERGAGARIEDNVLVTETGHVVLSRTGSGHTVISIDLSGKTILITGALGAIAEHMVGGWLPAALRWFSTDIKAEDQARRTLDRLATFPRHHTFISLPILPTRAR